MDFDTVFLHRRSIRSFEDRPIPKDVRDTIMTAALRAPTAGNMMLYSIIEIEEQSLKDTFAKTCDNQPFIAKSPLVLVFCADYARMMAFFKASDVEGCLESKSESMLWPRESNLMLATSDAIIAAQTAALASESLGLGSCYIGDIMEHWELHKDLLSLPRYCFPVAMLCIGYPTEQQKKRPQTPRLDSSIVIHKNRYAMPEPKRLSQMYSENQGYAKPMAGEYGREPGGLLPYNEGQSLYIRKFSADYSIEMRRSVAAMLEEWRRD